MPIYAYKCNSCGFDKDVLQKMSDSQLTECPACGKSTFSKQLTSAGFQLKGSGWYATDFRGGSGGSGGTAAPASEPQGASAEPAVASQPSCAGCPSAAASSSTASTS